MEVFFAYFGGVFLSIFELFGGVFGRYLGGIFEGFGRSAHAKTLKTLRNMIAVSLHPTVLADSLSPSLGRAQRSGARPL